METGKNQANATLAANANYLKTAGKLTILTIFLLLTFIVYDKYTSEDFVSLNRPVSYKKGNIKGQILGVMQRSTQLRRSDVISDSSHNPSSRFYSVWNDVDTQVVNQGENKTQEDKKKILVWNPWPPISMTRRACPSMPQCEYTKDRAEFASADAVIFWFYTMPNVYNKSWFPQPRPINQHWIMRTPDCPLFTRNTDWVSYGGVFNWTMTYRSDSDVYMPWGHITKLYEEIALKPDTLGKHYPKQKGKLVVWYVSNCYRKLTRFVYASELMRHIQVDVFGACGKEYCKDYGGSCFADHLHQYKFYLAFENFKCTEYITEKLWINGLKFDAVPIVLGAPRKDYERFAPPNSFIHVDDFKSPRALASYLNYLDQNEDKYMEYFAWKTNPPKNLPDFKSHWCEVCKKLVQVRPTERKVYNDIDRWWRGENFDVCESMVMVDNIRHKSNAIHYP
ncbi:alpha-(1,3)-fucosyltransferase 7-like [Branchiostoma lanceolatum]|uniref:alpha-(1,3)-fucosyltransferase 7-like n=1 Tax=Branchiostoma lanceolatum TaxID=7740 RepID=UPI003456F133